MNNITETVKHQQKVHQLAMQFAWALIGRAARHDRSKLEEPENSIFNDYVSQLEELTYGSDEYETVLERMKPAIEHHYAHNRHHPEHFDDGIAGMNLLDLVEMFLDWAAAVQRHEDGDLKESIEINAKRFDIPDELVSILMNSAAATSTDFQFF